MLVGFPESTRDSSLASASGSKKGDSMDGELKAILWAMGIIIVAVCAVQLFVPGGMIGLRDMLQK